MNKRDFHVYIIESPNAPDLYHRRFEGASLQETLRLSGVASSHRLTVNKEAFKAAFLIGLRDYFKDTSLPPIIHISAHGNTTGIQLTSGETIEWSELRELLIPVNTIMKGGLLISISSCEGHSGIIMAMEDDDKPFPYSAIIGNISKPTWGETNIAYATFYHLFAKGEDTTNAVNAMKVASGNNGFTLEFASSARKKYLEAKKTYENRINQNAAVATLQSSIPKKENSLTKALQPV